MNLYRSDKEKAEEIIDFITSELQSQRNGFEMLKFIQSHLAKMAQEMEIALIKEHIESGNYRALKLRR